MRTFPGESLDERGSTAVKAQQEELCQNKPMTALPTMPYNFLVFMEEWTTSHKLMSALILVILST